MVDEITSTVDTINPAEEIERQSLHAKAALDVQHEAKKESFHQGGPSSVAIAAREQRGSEVSRMRRALSAREGMAVNPKKLPTNNVMAMYMLMFDAAKSLKEFVKIEKKEMKTANDNWKTHSNTRAKCSDTAYNENEKYAKYTGAIMAASILSHGLRNLGLDPNTTTTIAQTLQGFSGTVQQWSEGTNQKTTSAATRADYSKDSSRSDFDMTRDEMRQLEQAVDQVHSQLIELMRLEAKAYSREGG